MVEDALTQFERLHHGWMALIRSPGWPLVEGEIADALRDTIERLAAGGLSAVQYERLGARVEAMLWLRHLPRRRMAEYDEAMRELREQPARPRPEGPVGWDEEEEGSSGPSMFP